ncbi:hypothetical protein MASR1M45_15470 [Candidatus Kapaibacterium sp.]
MSRLALLICVSIFYLISICKAQVTVNNPQVIMQYIQKSPILYSLDVLKDSIPPPDRSNNIVKNKFRRIKDASEYLIMEYDELIMADELYLKSNKLFDEKKFSEAESEFKKLYEKYPDYTLALTMQAKCLINQNKTDEALDILRKAISENYIDYEAHYLLADLYKKIDLIDAAVRFITTAHILNRNDNTIQSLMSEIYKVKGLNLQNWQFVPQIKYEHSRDEVKIYCKTQYEGYAWAEALWKFDNDYRITKNNLDKKYNLNQYQECLMYHSIALQALPWYAATEEGKAFKHSLETRKFNEFIFYEIILPEFPEESLKFTEDQMNKMVDYIMVIRAGQK